VIEAFYRQMAEVEDRHWWFCHRRALVTRLLARHAPDGHARALDLGCGTGGNARLLAVQAPFVVGLDRSALALALAHAKSSPAQLVRGDANRLAATFLPGSFDLVAAFNVLYHEWVGDVEQVLRDVRRVMCGGGCLVLTEPAMPILRRRHDVVDLGARRFRLGALRRLLRQAGFEVRFASHFNAVSLVPALAGAVVDRLFRRLDATPSADETVGEISEPPAPLDAMLRAACAIERLALGYGLRLPLGVGIVVVATLPVEESRQVRTNSIR